MIEQHPQSVYVHVPFCRHRCGYCNFALVADRDYLIDKFLDALQRELNSVEPVQPISTIFIGGGTPTHLNERQLETLISMIVGRFDLADEVEFTSEANPGDISFEKATLLSQLGVNRISLGAQSFNSDKLNLLERDHEEQNIIECVNICRSHFNGISLELIFGVHGELEKNWRTDLEKAVALPIDHLSICELTIEKGTQFWNRFSKNEPMKVSEDINARLYEIAIATLSANGFEQYEISSFAKVGNGSANHRCRHNQSYWNGNRYYAFGPGAASFVGNSRRTNHASVAKYIRSLNENRSPVVFEETLSDREVAIDILTFGIRQADGCDLSRLKSTTGFSLELLEHNALKSLAEQGLLEVEPDRIRLTKTGWPLADFVCQRIFNES